jgi:hypothetical protein
MDGGYNDWGLRVYGNSMVLNYAFMVLRGTGSSAAGVARVGLTPFANPYILGEVPEAQPLELGLSYLYDADRQATQRAFSLDAESQLGPLHIQAEYIRRKGDGPETPGLSITRSGYHVTPTLRVESWPLTPQLFVRYDTYRETLEGVGAEGDGPALNRLTAGALLSLAEAVQVKLEILQHVDTDEAALEQMGLERRAYAVQCVLSF